ncbi:hypothetical protein [Yoonia vestfoldensis]|uniref:hypothetical protein n=1 Tax=Yoonia vestfoldensis TaxID=245188 RepID=UPI0013A582F4|nr:hypothetical protein [Yoonia vestfoldensis]
MGLFGGFLKIAGIVGSVMTGNPAIAAGSFALANKIDKGGQGGFDQFLNAAGGFVMSGKSQAFASTAQNALLSGSVDYFKRRPGEDQQAYQAQAAFPDTATTYTKHPGY